MQEGDTVVDFCCGTGANFSLLGNSVGTTENIVEVDLSKKMLERARQKAERMGMKNVECNCASVDDFALTTGTTVVISTFGLEMVPIQRSVIQRMSNELQLGGRIGLLRLKHPDGWPDQLIELEIRLNRPFGVSREYENFRPWQAAQDYLFIVHIEEHFFGAAYSCVAEKTEQVAQYVNSVNLAYSFQSRKLSVGNQILTNCVCKMIYRVTGSGRFYELTASFNESLERPPSLE